MIIQSQATAEVTPDVLAKAFWEMDSKEQAAFFRALKKEVEGKRYEFETQSHYMCKGLCEEGRDALMTLSAPLFMHTLMACDKW